MRYEQVFTPNDIPTVTYVDRPGHDLEARLKEFYKIPNMIVSVSGPSKSGKTVLIKKVVSNDYLITVRGASIRDANDLWDHVLDWMGEPIQRMETNNSSNEISVLGEASGKAGIPIVAEGALKGAFGGKRAWGGNETKVYRRNGLEAVIKEISRSDFVVFIDDFHYIRPEIREEVGRQIKAAADSGVKVFTASVPHRNDDVVRSNPELLGRVVGVDIKTWNASDLVQIARKGFQALNIDISPSIDNRLAEEAFGSPQLMQCICLNLALVLDVKETLHEMKRIEVDNIQIDDTLLRTSAFTDYSKMLRDLHLGAKTRGTERKEHDLVDGTRGDVYRAILLAIKKNPAKMSFSYDEIINRVKEVCARDYPTGSSINSALTQMNSIAELLQPERSPISWDDPSLDIVDPYFLFFLRCSDKLRQIANQAS